MLATRVNHDTETATITSRKTLGYVYEYGEKIREKMKRDAFSLTCTIRSGSALTVVCRKICHSYIIFSI